MKNCHFLRWGSGNYCLGALYKGDFLNGRFQGKGTIVYPNGDLYDGQCQYDSPHGEGFLTLRDGTKHEGQFQMGEKHGKGKTTFTNGRDPLEGTYTDGLFDVSTGIDWESYSSEGA